MSNPDIIRVRHMLDAAQEALSFVGDKSRSELDANRMLTLSLTICAKHLQRDGCGGAKDRSSGCPDPVARRPGELHDRP